MQRVAPLIAALAIIATFIETALLHELTHLIVARILGIPVVQFYWLDPDFGVPTVYFGAGDWTWRMSIVHFSGGIVAGAIWGIVHGLLLRRGYFERNGAWWAFGAWLSVLTVWQLGQGLIEGALHGFYIEGTQQIGSASRMMQISFIVMGFLLHVTATQAWHYRWKHPVVEGEHPEPS